MYSKWCWAYFVWALTLTNLIHASNWSSTEWLRLLRYRHSFILGYESEADGNSFFVHPKGKKNPDLEFNQFYQDLQKPIDGDPNIHAVCKFPARTDFFRRIYPKLIIPSVYCEKFEKFKKRLSARSVSVVFSSYYLNNPASSYGHTFIRLGKEEPGNYNESVSSELLDTGVNYGANTGNANPITFGIGSFIGLFYGTYNLIPYYYKVREYNDFESRDLWTYHLDFSQREIDQIVRHIWELDQAEFRYYFLTENCSYHALTILEAVRPSLNLIKFLPARYIIPSDTLKVIVDQKIVKSISFRASASTTFYNHIQKLESQDLKIITNLLEGKAISLNYSDEKKAYIYDSAISLIDFKYAKEILKEQQNIQDLKRPILIARSKIPVSSPNLDYSKETKFKPHEGHNSGRLSIGGSQIASLNFFNVAYRFAFHDFNDFQRSYIPNSKVEMFSFKGVMGENRFTITEANIVDFYSLGSYDQFTKSFSWKLKIGQWQTYQRGTQGLTTQGISAGLGFSLTSRYIVPFFLLSSEASYVSEKMHLFKLSYGADAGFLINFHDNLRASSIYEFRAHPWHENMFKNELRLSNLDHSVGIFHNTQTNLGFSEWGINYMVYLK